MYNNTSLSLKNISKSNSGYLNRRHRLTFTQLSLLGWGNIDKNKLLEERAIGLSKVQKIRKVLEDLHSTEVEYLVIKGVELSQRLYGESSFRISKDIDILVLDREKIPSLLKDLINLGWSINENSWIEERPRQKWLMDLTFDISMRHPNGTLVEIHWNLDNYFFNLEDIKRKNLLLKNISEFIFFDLNIKVLSPELELIYLIIHGARHAWFRLKWLVDIYHFPIVDLDLFKFEKLAKEFEMTHLMPHVKYLIQDIFDDVWPIYTKDERSLFLYNISINQILKEKLNSKPNFMEFLNLLIHHVFWIQKPSGIIKMLFNTIGVRPNDIKEADLPFYWMYFFYRYISLIKRKFIVPVKIVSVFFCVFISFIG